MVISKFGLTFLSPHSNLNSYIKENNINIENVTIIDKNCNLISENLENYKIQKHFEFENSQDILVVK